MPCRNRQQNFLKRALLLLALSWSIATSALDLPEDTRVPGGVAIVPLNVTSSDAPMARYRGDKVLVIDHDGWKAVIGIPLDTEPGPQSLQLADRTIHFDIQPKAYPEERLTVKQKYVTPSQEHLTRIRSEQTRLRTALTHFSASPPETLRFSAPIQGRESSPFGLRRILNGEPRRPHSGLDLAAPTGTTILAPASGRVIDSGDFYFNGNTVLLDHGNGLITMYCHMSRILVENGQQLQEGEPLGEVGATGRVTGPHLHWGVTLNGTMIDPSLFLKASKTQ